MDFATILATTSQTVGLVKELRELDQSLQNTDVKAKMVEVYSALGDMKMAFADAQLEIHLLEKKNAELLENFKFQSELVEHEGYKYIPHDNNEPSGMPFCAVCEQNEGKFFLLTRSKGYVQFDCPNCKSVFHHLSSFSTKEFREARLSAESEKAASEKKVEVNGYKFDVDDQGDPKGYAYCPSCEKDDGEFYLLVDCILPNRTNCNKCKSTFSEADTKR